MSRAVYRIGSERQQPRISVNKLAEYLVAGPMKRRAIVRDQKFPPGYKVAYYDDATKAIVAFLRADDRDEESLLREVERLYTAAPANDYEHTKFHSNAEAIERFLANYDKLLLDDLKIAAGKAKPPKLNFEGVEISVRPELMLDGKARSKRIAGAIKLYLSKDVALGDSSAPYVSTLVHQFVALHALGEPSRKHCQVLDIFQGRVDEAPLSTKMRLKDIAAACQEIKLLWDSLAPAPSGAAPST